MKLLILFGPHAVGKVTVGQALAGQTGLKLFHNHMTIEPVCGLFDAYPKERSRLINLFRREIFEAFVKTEEKGLIFTYMWAFDAPSDWAYVNSLEALFASHGAETYYAELAAERAVRLERNKTENRLLHKPSKRNLTRSEALFLRLEEKYRLNSLPDEIQKPHYIKIDNTDLPPEAAAGQIRAAFGF